MHHAFGLAFIVAAIGFAFGVRTAQVCVAVALLTGLAACVYIGFLIVTGAI
jgi:hypothetical protein